MSQRDPKYRVKTLEAALAARVAEVVLLRRENAALRKQVADLTRQFNDLRFKTGST